MIMFIFSIMTLAKFILFPGYNGLPVTGQYEVNTAEDIWVDESRLEEFENDGSHREVPVHFYYPDVEGAENEFPLIVFSHGAFGYYQSNSSTYFELASKGYVVVSLDHPYHSFYTRDTDGKLITVNPDFMQDCLDASNEVISEEEIYEKSAEWVKLRSDDINFVIDEIKNAKSNGINTTEDVMMAIEMADDTNIGLFGHSMGGASSVNVGRERNDVNAVIDLDGTMLGEQVDFKDGHYILNTEPYPVPILAISNEEHQTTADQYGLLYVNNYVIENAVDGRETYFKNSGHMNFTDLPLFSPALASLLGTGSVDAKECIEQMNELVGDYFDYYLKNEGNLNIKECYE